jgi:hypothetical protein
VVRGIVTRFKDGSRAKLISVRTTASISLLSLNVRNMRPTEGRKRSRSKRKGLRALASSHQGVIARKPGSPDSDSFLIRLGSSDRIRYGSEP